MTLLLRTLFAGALLAILPAAVLAQGSYPTKPVRLIVAFPPGGSTDIIARLVAQKLSERLGQQVIIDNRGGAGGMLGTDIAAKSPADGYTLTMGTTSTHVIAPAAYPNVKYDPIKDFVALMKAQPGKLNYASAGAGSTTHLAMEMMKIASGADIVHVPYNGNGPAGIAVLGGQVQALFGSMPAVLPQAKSGKLRAIAVGTAKRSPALPDVPTVAEQGFPGFEVSLWLGFFAPKGTPAAITTRLYDELQKIAKSPEMKEQFEKNGADPAWTTPAELTKLMKTELEKYSKVIKQANIKL